MIIDIHCHFPLPRCPVQPDVERSSFEKQGSQAVPGLDAYLSQGQCSRLPSRIVAWKLGLGWRLDQSDTSSLHAQRTLLSHLLDTTHINRAVVLAFDEYYDEAGTALCPNAPRRLPESSMYTSNSLVHHLCRQHPDKLLFGASIHPYRKDALSALEEVAAKGAVLVKWLPIVQNIEADDERTRQFLIRAAELRLPMLVHYGSESTLPSHHSHLADPEPILQVLTELHQQGQMPTFIIAHVATPTLPWQTSRWFESVVRAMTGPLCDAPLYADVSALIYKPKWLRRLIHASHLANVRSKLLYGSDFPIPPSAMFFPCSWRDFSRIRRSHASWVEQSYHLMRHIGVSDDVFARASTVLGLE